MKLEEQKNETLDNLEVPVSIERFVKEIPKRYQREEFDQTRIEKVDKEWKDFQKNKKRQWTLKKKAITIGAAAAASFLLLLGSGFVSPTMAKVLSKIPPISAIYEQMQQQPDLAEQVMRALEKEGYQVKEVQEHIGGDKEGIYVYLPGTENEIKEMTPGVKKIAGSIIHGENYQGTRYEDYYVRVRKHIDPSEEWKKEEARIQKETSEIFEIVRPVLESYGLQNSLMVSLDHIQIEIPNTLGKEKTTEIKTSAEAALKANGKQNIEVKMSTFDQEKRDQYSRWSEVVSSIGHEFMTYKKYQVSGVGYQSKDGVMNILITVKPPSTDTKATELATDLHTMVEEFIKTDEIWEKVKDDSYKIIIRDKKGKQLN